ncbi:hypothetical protein L0B70_00455 [Kaistella sp. 97-N-M2]|uniref:hypothetical protein n=1 Tax=Kaistella sp. 97-N-M2 TaxID=2908645 RepID=UPI001F345242|nr:hypothetical protein [Kaistella sp. 97-N-M2]UJF29899.1 hypothetical protein L0B70_00455 [Kaistella sp. 97-N-M2]
MINPVILKELMMEATASIPSIKKREVLVTDDELVELLGDHKAGDNILLVAVLPTYGGGGQEDEASIISYMQFFLLEKVDYKSFKNRDEYLNVFERTLAAAVDFLVQMFTATGRNCTDEILQYDYQIRPVSRKAQCNGYEIQIDSKAFIDNY